MRKPLFTGSGVAIVTPFTKDTVDLDAFGRLIDFQLANGTDAVIVCGTTGEASTMTYGERMRTIEYCVECRSSPAAAPTPLPTPSLWAGMRCGPGPTVCWW